MSDSTEGATVARTSLTGRVVAVTGGAQGIGREIAAQLARAGAQVAIGDRDADAALASAESLPGVVEAFALDVADSHSFATFLRTVEQKFGQIDVLVNNAGVMWVGEFDEEPESAAQRQLDVNLHGVIRGLKLAAPKMRERGRGHIVTVASAASKLAPAGEATYAATKHGVYGYLRAVKTELRGSGVELSVIMPGVVETELAAGTVTGPTRRLTPEEVAEAVVAVIRRPRFEVMIPRRIRLVTTLSGLLPERLRDRLLRATVPNQVTSATNKSVREGYESRFLATGSTQTPGETP